MCDHFFSRRVVRDRRLNLRQAANDSRKWEFWREPSARLGRMRKDELLEGNAGRKDSRNAGRDSDAAAGEYDYSLHSHA